MKHTDRFFGPLPRRSQRINNFISCSCKWSFEFHPYLMNWSNLAHFWTAPTTSYFIGTFPPTIGLTFLKPCAQAKPSPYHLCRGLKGLWPFSVRRGTKKLPFQLTRYLFFGGSKAPRGAWRARFPVQGWWEKLGIAFQTWDGVEKKEAKKKTKVSENQWSLFR